MHGLVFQHIACEHPGIFRDLMRADGVSWDAVEVDEGENIPDFAGYDFMMVMGGPMDVWQKQENPWLVAEIAAIHDWVSDGKPYIGFCLGHQLLAEAMGGEVGPAATPEIGILPVQLTEEGLESRFFENAPREIYSLQWHSAEVTKVPPGAAILASSKACNVNAMSFGDHAFSVQFHVELTPDTVREWGDVPEYASALEKAMGEGALQKMDSAAADKMLEFNQLSSILYRNFIERVRAA
ncbi:MAG: type 1 glutamine amidotransferase [Pseudomonadota bacterium]